MDFKPSSFFFFGRPRFLPELLPLLPDLLVPLLLLVLFFPPLSLTTVSLPEEPALSEEEFSISRYPFPLVEVSPESSSLAFKSVAKCWSISSRTVDRRREDEAKAASWNPSDIPWRNSFNTFAIPSRVAFLRLMEVISTSRSRPG